MISKHSVMTAFENACAMSQAQHGINLCKALVIARDFLPDRRYKVFALAGCGNGHGDTGGLIECANIKLWWKWCNGSIIFEDYR